MFGVSRLELIEGLTRIGENCCGYGGGEWLHRRCDCKYGASVLRNGEATGCPELRSVVALLYALQDNEYEAVCRRANIIGIDDMLGARK